MKAFVWVAFMAFVILISSTKGRENFRTKRQAVLCKVPKVCQVWCRISGHSDGVCDDSEDCLCSGEDVEKHFCSDEHYTEDEQHTICAGICQFKGKQTGDCNDDQECICVEQELKGDHVKCVSDAVCKMYCQFDQKARTGKCGGDYGWDCVCSNNDEKNEIEEV